MDNYLAKSVAICVMRLCPDGNSKNHPTPQIAKHPKNNHFDLRNLLRVGLDIFAFVVRATSDINIINSAIWPCVLALNASALSSRAANAGGKGKKGSAPDVIMAPIVEEGLADGPISREVLRHYLGHPALQDIDCLILACTHYPLLQKEVEAHYQGRVDVLDSARLTAQAVQEALKITGTARQSEERSAHRFLVSEHTAAFAENAQRFFGGDLQLEEARLRV